jgi:hypothetical protein
MMRCRQDGMQERQNQIQCRQNTIMQELADLVKCMASLSRKTDERYQNVGDVLASLDGRFNVLCKQQALMDNLLSAEEDGLLVRTFRLEEERLCDLEEDDETQQAEPVVV